MAVLATVFLVVFFFLSVRVNAADDDVNAYQQTEDDVTRSPGVKSRDVVKAKYLNVLERKLKTFPHQKQVGEAMGKSGATEAKRRSWAENSMYAWGKRLPQALQLGEPRFKRSAPYMVQMSADPTGAWGEEASVGKERLTPSEDSDEEDISEEEEEEGGSMDHHDRGRQSQQKRRWSDHSMNAWGKRLQTGKPIDLGEEDGASDPHPPPQKSHSSNRIYFVLLNHKNGVSKRNWATNTMDVWGKRSTPQNRGDAPW